MPRTRLLFLGVLAVLGLAWLVLDPDGLSRTRRLQADLQGLEARNEELRAMNDGLRRELKALADDPKALERAAREELGLVRPGEVVFRLEDGDAARAP